MREGSKKGYTLIELMIVIAIVGIFSSIALPGFQTIVTEIRISSAMNTMSKALRLARRQAVLLRKTVRICASNDGQLCNGSRNLAEGWIMYVDDSKQRYRTSTDQLLSQQSPLKGLKIRYNRAKEIKFNYMGRIGLNGSISICPKNSHIAPRRLVLIHSGRIRRSSEGVKCLS